LPDQIVVLRDVGSQVEEHRPVAVQQQAVSSAKRCTKPPSTRGAPA
jgi:hypothetical protein